MKFKIFMILACSFAGTIDAGDFDFCKDNAIGLIKKLKNKELFISDDNFFRDFGDFEKFLQCTILPIFKDTEFEEFFDSERGPLVIKSILKGFEYLFELAISSEYRTRF